MTLAGARELFRPGENALTFTPGDADELAARIRELHAQPALRCRIAETAQAELLSQGNETVMADRIETCLDTALQMWQVG